MWCMIQVETGTRVPYMAHDEVKVLNSPLFSKATYTHSLEKISQNPFGKKVTHTHACTHVC